MKFERFQERRLGWIKKKNYDFEMDKSGDHHENPTQLNSEDIIQTVTGADGDVKVETKMDSNAVLMQTILRQNELLLSMLTSMSLQKEEVYWSPVVIKSLPVFNGKDDSNEASNWLKILREAANLYRWPETSKLEVARVNLEGPARKWYTEQNFKSWFDFEQQFEMTYVKKPCVAIRWKILIQRVQGRNEDVLEYYRDKIRMCKDLELSFTDTKVLVMDGMKFVSKAFFDYLLSRLHTNEDEFIIDIMSYVKSLSIHYQNEQQPSEVDGECSLVKTISKTEDSNDVNSNRAINDCKSVCTCPNCQSSTQTASDCPIEKGPEGGSTTHQQSDCSNQIQMTQERNTEGQQQEQEQDQGGLFNETTIRGAYYIKLSLKALKPEIIINALIDSSSPISLIKSRFVEDCNKQPFKNNFEVFGINRTPLDIQGVVMVDILMMDYNIGRKQIFYVVSDQTMLVGCSLGRDSIKGLNISFGTAGKIKIKELKFIRNTN